MNKLILIALALFCAATCKASGSTSPPKEFTFGTAASSSTDKMKMQ